MSRDIDPAEWSEAQILAAISLALRKRDMEAVVGLLHLLAFKNPRVARTILDTIEMMR